MGSLIEIITKIIPEEWCNRIKKFVKTHPILSIAATVGIGILFLWGASFFSPNEDSASRTQNVDIRTQGGDTFNIQADGSTVVTGSGNHIEDIEHQENYYTNFSEWHTLCNQINDKEELLQFKEDSAERLRLSTELNELTKKKEQLEKDICRIAETINSVDIDTERFRKAKAFFNEGKLREADEILNAESLEHDLSRLEEEERRGEQVAENARKKKEQLANEYRIKAQLRIISYDRPNRIEEACGFFEKALRASKAPEILFVYALFLVEHNHHLKKAVSLYEETLGYCRELASENPEKFLPDVAGTLNNLANLQSDLQETPSARASYEEALRYYRELASANPEKFLPDVAGTLNNLANLQSDLQETPSARASYEEALKIRRELASANPEKFLPDVATTLNNLANLQSDLQDYPSARASYEEALRYYRELASTNPEKFLPYVAGTLNNLANLQSDLQDYPSARASYEEALKIRRELASANPEKFLPDVATTLINMGIFYLEGLSNREKSIAAAREAIEILTPIQHIRPAYKKWIDMSRLILEKNGVEE